MAVTTSTVHDQLIFANSDPGGIAIDYTSYLERIATSLETLAHISTSTGIRTVSPYDWVPGIENYDWYIQQSNTLTTTSYTATTFTKFIQAVDSIAGNLPKFK